MLGLKGSGPYVSGLRGLVASFGDFGLSAVFCGRFTSFSRASNGTSQP